MRKRGRGLGDASAAHAPRLHVAFLLVPQFTLSAFAAFVDTLRLAKVESVGTVDAAGAARTRGTGARSAAPMCTWAILGVSPDSVRSSCGVELAPVEVARSPERFDCVVVVGGSPADRGAPLPVANAFLRAAAAHGVPLVAIGTGVEVLARLGLSDAARSSCAVEAVAALAARLVARHCGPVPAPGFVARAPRDPLVARATAWIERTLADGRRLTELGAVLGISMRQLQRRFLAEVGMTPQAYRARLRLLRSRAMLESTALPVGRIGLECGFADGAHFSRTFRRAFRAAPSRVRDDLARADRMPEFESAVQEYGFDATF